MILKYVILPKRHTSKLIFVRNIFQKFSCCFLFQMFQLKKHNIYGHGNINIMKNDIFLIRSFLSVVSIFKTIVDYQLNKSNYIPSI